MTNETFTSTNYGHVFGAIWSIGIIFAVVYLAFIWAPSLDAIQTVEVIKSSGGVCLLDTSYGDRIVKDCPYDVGDHIKVKFRKEVPSHCPNCIYGDMIP